MMTIRWPAFLLALLLAACGGGTETTGGKDLAPADAGSDGAGGDVVFVPDDTVDLVQFDGPGMELTEPETMQPACDPGEGCFLDPCTENSDCLSSWCVEHMGDSVCSQTCETECPAGWSCRQVGAGGPDVAFICVSTAANLCKPCASTSDCQSAGGADDLCIAYGDEGSFCGSLCESDADCPWGFSCSEAITVDGIDTWQCVADTGSCPCTARSVELSLWTPCTVGNEFGSCTGMRICTEEGLTECDAPVPAAEMCNGLDDDCDGFTDEPLEEGGDFINLCDDGNDCTDDTCNGEAGCAYENLDNIECGDDDACTVGDHCEAGQCVGDPVICDDEDLCTDNLCSPVGGCEYPVNTAACDDGDPCTVNDQCSEGLCAGFAVGCDCQVNADCLPLEDGDLCNGTLVCDTSELPYACVVDPDTVVNCPVAEGPDAVCLETTCDPGTGACGFAPIKDGYACEDGNACTIGDTCSQGVCGGGVALNCSDDNLCTDDSCLPDSGCLHEPNSKPCSDGDVCTTGDLCEGGECVGGAPLSCDDSNPCTDDACDVAVGCVHEPNTAACNDQNACTLGDICSGGICTSDTVANCDDGNPCTDDSCLPPNGCQHDPNTAPCDDQDMCTITSQCADGTCQGGLPLECSAANYCALNPCLPVCVNASCDPDSGCLFELVADCCGNGLVDGNEGCDDGNAAEGDGCSPVCQVELEPGYYFELTGNPDPAHVFDAIEVTFRYPDNRSNGIWHRMSMTVLAGDFTKSGYWAHPSYAGGYPEAPDNGSGRYGRFVHMPATGLVAYTVSAPNDGLGPAFPEDLRLATIDPDTGELGPPMVPQFSDGYDGPCNVLSSSATELLVFNGSNRVYRYTTQPGSGLLAANGSVYLSQALPGDATCTGGHCNGGTFAWDGQYFYFSMSQDATNNLTYAAYDAQGDFVDLYWAAGGASVNSVYFDWSVGRYSVHDGTGFRQGGEVFSSLGNTTDSQVYSPLSAAHTLVPAD